MLLLPARSWWLLSRSELSAPCISSDAPSSSSSLSMLLARLSPSHMCAGSASPSSVSSRSVVWFAARYGCSCCGCSARWKPKGSRKVSANIPTLPTRDCSANNVSPSPESSISASSTCEPSQRDRKNKRKTTGRIRAATPPLPSPVLHHAVGSTPRASSTCNTCSSCVIRSVKETLTMLATMETLFIALLGQLRLMLALAKVP
mmetsp:Transcript_1455/g.5014  ORF Transcript_1455/g.5014 Transcript_1455/m.5014 type:complete len:203 (-) Transcript_1455:1130-1738(-)